MASGWAYVGCTTGSAPGAQGVIGSLQFHTGSGGISGSSYLSWSYGGPVRSLKVSGNLDVSGTIYADAVDVVNITHQTISYLSSSGNTIFGDTLNDLHEFTGSISVSSSLTGGTVGQYGAPVMFVTSSGRVGIGLPVYGTSSVPVPPSASLHISGSVAVHYTKLVTSAYTVEAKDYIIGISSSAAVTLTLPTAASMGAGRLLIVKDEYYDAGTARNQAMAVTASGTDSELIDGQTTYYMYGSNQGSFTLYSDGVDKWFVA
jgi:hypothetical protein